MSSNRSHSGSGSSQYSDVFSYAESVDSSYTEATQYTAASEAGFDFGYDNLAAGNGGLPCEFVGMEACDVTFDYNDIRAWEEHIITVHLQGKLPSTAICWFCDGANSEFKAKNFNNNRSRSFHHRMLHIHDHILNDGLGVHDMRPDLHMNEHLYRSELISEKTYNDYKKWHELPVPREQTGHIQPRGFVPPDRQRQRERENQIYIDPKKEERQRRKEKKKHSK
ncbi:hypothetical protein GGR54DRAFT_4996 [Hypoxylon sp. NC1633]|nr:hypothetical protein GGR54DRAFT_4996 [Hypoxylon sp. NC1633]